MDVMKEIKEEPGVAAAEPSVSEALPTRVRIPETDEKPSHEMMMDLWQKQQIYIDHLEEKMQKTGKNTSKNFPCL